MRPEEANFLNAVLIAATILLLIFITFTITLLRYSKKGLLSYLKKVEGDLKLVEREKKRIAGDVHDGIGANLSAARLLVNELLSSGQADDALKVKIVKSFQDMSVSVREVSNRMVPYVLQREGLSEALTELIDDLFNGSAIQLTTDFRFSGSQLPDEFALQVYRITQELLHNVIRHAKATHVNVSIGLQKEKLILMVRDNGVGFSKTEVKRHSKGIGLLSVSSRILLLEGRTYLTTSQDRGVEYVIELPIRKHVPGSGE